MVRPYAIWVDALRAVPAGQIPERSRQDLAVLQPASEPPVSEDRNRTRLFAAMADIIGQLARAMPLVVAFDDLQWIDEASASLLHYLLRILPASRVLFVSAARPDELDDNPWAKRLLQSLERDCRPDKIVLAPLNREETAALMGAGTTATEMELGVP